MPLRIVVIGPHDLKMSQGFSTQREGWDALRNLSMQTVTGSLRNGTAIKTKELP